MNIIIKESQLQKLIEQVKVDKVEVLADQIWDATSGIGTDEDKVYDALKQITNLQFFVKVNTKLISKYKESFYDIVNSTMEFTDSEKNEIVKILNSKGVAHIINDNGDIKYKKSQTQFTSQQGANFYSDPTILTPSENLISFLKCEEGKVGSNCQPMLKSYKVPGDVWTIGWGHTGEYAKPEAKIDQTTAEKILNRDANVASECVKRIFNEWKSKKINVSVTQSMFDTLTSLAFNAGCGSLRGTGSENEVIDFVKKGKYKEAADTILSFKSDKPGFSGLKKRREKEKEMFCKDGGCA
jgi:lysozyme